jgi:hypothetical protein
LRRFYTAIFASTFALTLALSAAASTFYPPTANGQWAAYPGQSTTFGAAVQQPINTDGSSNFKANGKTVIPVKFALSQGTGAFVFESVPGVAGRYAYSILQWQAKATNAPITLNQLTTLIADYVFTTGDCQAGSLRWTVTLNDRGVERNLDIHYQPGHDSLSEQTCAAGTSGHDMTDLTSTDPYVVINQFVYAGSPYTFTSANPAYNTTYSDAVSQLGNLVIVQNGITLIVDSGTLAQPEVVNLTSATVGVGNGNANPYTDTWTPLPASPMTTTCPTAEAKFSITKVDGAPTGDVNEPLSIQPQDSNLTYRIVDCKYMYNLATSSLSGVGTYTVKATIGSTTFTVATFDLK